MDCESGSLGVTTNYVEYIGVMESLPTRSAVLEGCVRGGATMSDRPQGGLGESRRPEHAHRFLWEFTTAGVWRVGSASGPRPAQSLVAHS